MGERVTIPADVRAKLAAATDPVELCDDAGNVVGYALTPAQMAALDARPPLPTGPWTDAEIQQIAARSRADTRPRRTMAEVMRLVEGE